MTPRQQLVSRVERMISREVDPVKFNDQTSSCETMRRAELHVVRPGATSWWRCKALGAAVLMLMGGAAGARGQAIPPALKTVVYRHAPFVIHEVKKGTQNKRAVDHMLTTDFD